MEHQLPPLHINTSFKNFIEIPVRGLKWIIDKLKLAEIFKKLIEDPRQFDSPYPIESLLMAGLQIPIFRQPSRNHFYQHLSIPHANVGNNAYLAGMIDNRFPSTRTLEDTYQRCDPSQMQEALFAFFESLIKSKVFANHHSLLSNGRYLLAIDAFCIHTYHDSNQHPCRFCPYCLKRQRAEKVWFLHIIVVASIVSPTGFQFPLYVHRVRKEVANPNSGDNSFKEECELSSLPVILKDIRQHFPKLRFTLLLDSLYANGNVLDLCEELHFDYEIVRKEGSFSSLNSEIQGLQQSPNLSMLVHKFAAKRFQVYQNLQFFNDLSLPNRTVNIIDLQETCKKNPSKRFAKIHQKQSHWQWIVASSLNQSNVIAQAKQARNRWKEEDLGNSLKNRGFNIKHDFSRHPQSQSIWIYLQFIAYGLTSLFLLSEIGYHCRKKYTIRFLMEQMLEDLVRCPFDFLFHFSGSTPQLLRFFIVPAAG